MKGFKSLRPNWSGHKPEPSQFGETPRKAKAEMQTDVPSPRAAGRLSREDQRRLGDILQRVYDDVIQQGVPDRFRDLLNELDNSLDPTRVEGALGGSRSASGENADKGNPGSDRLVEANRLDHGDKGPLR